MNTPAPRVPIPRLSATLPPYAAPSPAKGKLRPIAASWLPSSASWKMAKQSSLKSFFQKSFVENDSPSSEKRPRRDLECDTSSPSLVDTPEGKY